MKSIRVKVRTLILIGVLIVVGIFFADNIYWSGISLYNRLAPDDYKIDVTKMITDDLESEAKRLDILMTNHDYVLYNLVTIGDGSVISSTRIRAIDAQKVYESYREFDKTRPVDIDNNYRLNVLLIQWLSGNTESTKILISEIENIPLDQEDRNHFYLIKAAVDLAYFELEAVEEDLVHIDMEIYERTVEEIKKYLNDICGYDIDYRDDLMEMKMYATEPYNKYFTTIYDYNDYYNEDDHEVAVEGVQISGQVTIEGEPIEGVFVYGKHWPGVSSFEGFDVSSIITDENGKYSFTYPRKDIKRVCLMVPWQLVHDKSIMRPYTMDIEDGHVEDFTFNPGLKFNELYIEGDDLFYTINDPMGDESTEYLMIVSYYNLEVPNSRSYISIKGVEGRLPLEELRKETSFAFGMVSSEDPVNYLRLMDHLYLSEDYIFEISKIVETSGYYVSNGIFPEGLSKVLYVPGVELNQGDLLLKDRKVKEAMEWYEENPSRHNLKVLIALYGYGYIPKEEMSFQRLDGRDTKKALSLLEELMILDGETESRWRDYQHFAELNYDYESEYKALMNLEKSEYIKTRIGINTILRQSFDEGVDYLLENTESGPYDDWKIAFYLLGNEISGLPSEYMNLYEKLDWNEMSDFYNLIHTNEYDKAWEALALIEDDDLRIMHELLYIDAVELDTFNFELFKEERDLAGDLHFSDYYRDQVNMISNRYIVQLLKLLKEDSNWFY